MRIAAPALCLLAVFTPVSAQEPTPDTPRDVVIKALDWISRQAVPVKDHPDAVMFPETAEQPEQQAARIYGGTAGVLLFLENAAAVLDDEGARKLADRTAAGLLASATKDEHGITWASSPDEGTASLYVGDAGIGAAFLARASLRNDAEAKKVATQIGDALLGRGDRSEDQLGWDDQVEIIYGGAGTALFLLELAEATNETRFRDAAKAVGRWLIAESELQETAPPRRMWRWALAGNQPYVGFSHGTAGVAYALLRIGIDCEDEACIQAAKDGAEWLFAQGIREKKLLRWPVVADSERSMGGWCHGPPGTARLFLSLHAHSGADDKRYLAAALESAGWVMAQAGPADAETPPAFPPSYCCGVAGVLDFFCDLYRATGEQAHADFAKRAGGYLIDLAVADESGVKWANGANAHGSSTQRHNVDLMLGASGEAYALLRLMTLDQEEDPIAPLSDRRIVQ